MFQIRYMRGGKTVAETLWPIAIPPSVLFVHYSLMVHDADAAIVADGEGKPLTVERWNRASQKFN